MSQVTPQEIQPNKVYWPAAATSFGDLPEYEIILPAEAVGKLDIYKVPVSDVAPDGYLVLFHNTGSDYNSVVPGTSHEVTFHLASLRLTGIPTVSESTGSFMGSTGVNEVLWKNDEFPLNASMLNVNDFTPEVDPEGSTEGVA